jgi:hypothetical protein
MGGCDGNVVSGKLVEVGGRRFCLHLHSVPSSALLYVQAGVLVEAGRLLFCLSLSSSLPCSSTCLSLLYFCIYILERGVVPGRLGWGMGGRLYWQLM